MEDKISKFLRVNQAGEIGAVRIYQGQLAVLKNPAVVKMVQHMAEQEHHHLRTFDRLIEERNVRPTLLGPLCHVAGFILGATTALMGERAAMACTAAVEEVIDGHYAGQAAQLGDDEAPLRQIIEEFKADEVEHMDLALANGAEQATGYPILSAFIKAGCRTAIWMAERI